ncbi:class I SAM-dependent methyltransferase [Streptomyces sp. NPDC093065]|uniref:class I SAM-dependent methyltransferase n=1 Tax=Streptomyces sp. NPDC093065 TaxID=3366021 RepID=UPI00381EC073
MQDVIEAWDRADPRAIHPTRATSEDAYWQSGTEQAAALAGVFKPGSRIVDVGCGDGRVAIPLQQLGYDVTGADSSSNMLRRLAETEPGIRTVQSTGPDLREQLGRKQDGAYCLAVLIHHTRADALDIVRGIVAAVRKGGTVVLDWPVSDRPHERRHWIDVTTWDPSERDTAADTLGLDPIDSPLPWATYRVR